MRLEKYLDSFIIEMRNTKNLSNKSIKAYYSDILNFIKFINEQNDKLINSENLIKYIDSLRTIKKLKDSSIKRKIISLNFAIWGTIKPAVDEPSSIIVIPSCNNTDAFFAIFLFSAIFFSILLLSGTAWLSSRKIEAPPCVRLISDMFCNFVRSRRILEGEV